LPCATQNSEIHVFIPVHGVIGSPILKDPSPEQIKQISRISCTVRLKHPQNDPYLTIVELHLS